MNSGAIIELGRDWFGMKNKELGVRQVKYTMITRTQVAASVGNWIFTWDLWGEVCLKNQIESHQGIVSL